MRNVYEWREPFKADALAVQCEIVKDLMAAFPEHHVDLVHDSSAVGSLSKATTTITVRPRPWWSKIIG